MRNNIIFPGSLAMMARASDSNFVSLANTGIVFEQKGSEIQEPICVRSLSSILKEISTISESTNRAFFYSSSSERLKRLQRIEVKTQRRKMTFENLEDILNDSFSPALVLPSPLPSKVFYPSLRRAIGRLSAQEPFVSLVPGDSISFLFPNSLEFVICFFAITGQRCIANPLNPTYKKAELLFYLKDVQPKVVLVLEGASNVSETLEAAQEVGIPVYALSLHVDGSIVPRKKRSLLRKSRSLFQWAANGVSTGLLPVLEPFLTCRSLDANHQPVLLLSKNEKVIGKKSLDDIALFLHTSGTTGRPKLVPLTHGNILASLANIQSSYHLSVSDATYLVMPLFHVHGLIGALLSTLYSGGTVILPPKFSVTSFWDDFLTFKIHITTQATWYTAVPTIHQLLLSRKKETFKGNTGKLRLVSCHPRAPSTFKQLEETFKVPVIEAYAMTEAAHQMAANSLPPGPRLPGSVGKGKGVEILIMDEFGKVLSASNTGEVCIRGKNVIKEYFNNPKATAESFHPDPKSGKKEWFRTGDLGYTDLSGHLYLVGRIKEQINRGGEKISPTEIDQTLLLHPHVAEAVAFGVPSALYGQEIEAAVVPTLSSSLTELSLVDFLKTKLAPFKIPRKIHMTSLLPKTATGKIQRKIVADVFVKDSPKL